MNLRRAFQWGMILGVLLWAGRDVLAAAEGRPNVIVILLDDLGYGDLSSYGAKDLRSPNIDSLIESGMRFDRFYANCPVCSPTRAAFLTGRFPDVAGVPGVIRTHASNSWGYLDPSVDLLPAVLNRAGYDTALVGKWHLGLESPNTPNERGFRFFHGFLGDMMDDYYTHRRHGENYMRKNERTIDPAGHATDLFTDWAVDYLRERGKESGPFFLYLAYNAPHTPIQPPPDWLRRVQERESGISERRAKLVALIEHLDAGVGRVMGALNETGLARNTVVILTSDNGGQLGVGANCGNLRGGKGDMHEGGIRVPMAVAWPGQIVAGGRSEQAALTMDLYPSLCELAGIEPEEGLDGVSLVDLWLGRKRELAARDLVWVRREGGLRYNGQEYYAFRRGPWKLAQNDPFERFQLFNLDEDPLERVDRAEDERAIYSELAAALRKHTQRAGRVVWQAPR